MGPKVFKLSMTFLSSHFFFRFFGWLSVAWLSAFLLDNILIVGFDFPGAFSILNSFNSKSFFESIIYLIFVTLALFFVLRNKNSFREDSYLLHNFNTYLIRSFFWAIVLVGVTDFSLAFMRVENLLEVFLSKDFANKFNYPSFVGTYVHLPLIAIGFLLGKLTKTIGFHYLSLLIVVAEFVIVISRYVFSYEQTFMGDLVRYWYAGLFLFASAFTLFEDSHVRVDIIYQGLTETRKALINALGAIFFGCTTSIVIIFLGFNGKHSIINSPVKNFEVSMQGNVGMYVKYHLAAFLGIFAVTMFLQFISYFFESIADLRGEKGKRVIENYKDR